MTNIKFGGLSIDPAAMGSQGNAVLGIRDSGKTYTATWFAERLFEAGVPFTTFDPTGVWRFLRVPSKGRGYPIVVAGGKAGDLPLNPASAPKIVEAAMQSGVSLVIDLFDMNLSKADWRRIVKDSLTLLMHKNQEHGLRHIFLEEAAEFVPQKVLDGDVYAVVERLARMGGNFRLGYTLINQRSQEVNKAVLELCENLFLHRQRGKNALENLKKWLEIGSGSDADKITDSIASLPTGQCWAWLGGEEHPLLVKVPEKHSFHPDRRAMHGDVSAGKVAAAVDVGKFVATLKDALPAIQAEIEANDPAALKRKIAELEKQLRAKAPAAAPAADLTFERSVAYNAGWAAAMKDQAKARSKVQNAVATARMLMERAMTSLPSFEATDTPAPLPPVVRTAQPQHVAAPPRAAAPIASPQGDERVAGPLQAIIDGLAWWEAVGNEQPTRVQVAAAANRSSKSSSWETYLSRAKSQGLITYPSGGTLALTDHGRVLANHPGSPPSTEELHRRVQGIIGGPEWKLLAALIAEHPKALSVDEIGAAAQVSCKSSSFETYMSRLKSMSLVDYPSPGMRRAADWLFV